MLPVCLVSKATCEVATAYELSWQVCADMASCRAQGHLRLVLLPIVYNAMAAKENLRTLPLFIALQKAMRASSYDRLLRHPSKEPITPQQREPGAG